MEVVSLKLGMFETLMLGAISIFIGEYLRKLFPILKKYCLPAAVVGGTLLSIVSLILYKLGVVALDFDFKTVNTLFYCIFFAASGAAASMALLKQGGKLVVIFAILAAILAACQNALALLVGGLLKVDPLISMMTGSIPMTGGHGNAAAFAPIAVEAGASAAMEVAIASATFGLISGCILGGPFGNFIIKRHKLQNPELDGLEELETSSDSAGILVNKNNIIKAVLLMCFAIGLGQVCFLILKHFNLNLPIHVCCMFGGIVVRFVYDIFKKGSDTLYEAFDIVGEFSLALFVSMSIVSMKLWQLAGLGFSLLILLFAQVIFIALFCYFVSFYLLGKNYDAAVMAVGHTGFGLGAVPVAMTTMQTVCRKYRYSKLAFFVVPVIGGFISNLSNAIIISKFLDLAKNLSM